MVFPVFFRNGIAFGFIDPSSNGRHNTGNEHKGGGIILDKIIDQAQAASQSGKYKAVGKTDNDKGNRPHGQDQKTGENNDMQYPGQHITGLAHLAQPDHDEVQNPLADMIKPVVRICPHKGSNPSCHDIGK